MPKQFGAYEISLVGTINDSTEPLHGLYGQTSVEECENLYAEEPDRGCDAFWSLYGHVKGEGAHCIGDFQTQAGAFEILSLILGRDLNAHAENGDAYNWIEVGER